MFTFTAHALERLQQRGHNVCGGDIDKVIACLKPINYPKKSQNDVYFYVDDLIFICREKEVGWGYVILTVIRSHRKKMDKYIDRNDPQWIAMKKNKKHYNKAKGLSLV